jgi:transposase
MAPQLTNDKKLEAINLFNVCKNARLVGRSLNRSASTVKRWVDKWEIEGTIERKVGSGLKSKKTTAKEDETLLQY